ncbi:MAG: hypothetical protein K8I03_08310 [Ignavibacteria bacterium]|nr:hypothetical protein [Ignavibacteria bacterium]
MKKTIFAAVILLIIFFSQYVVLSQDVPLGKLSLAKEHTRDFKIESKNGNSPLNTFFPEQLLAQQIESSEVKFNSVDRNIQQTKKKKKSVGLGILLSALLPGAGEFYGEDYLKAGIFFGVELLAWGTYFYFDSKGNKKTEEFQSYADQYWDVRTYARWLKDEGFQNSSQINPDEPNRDVLRAQIMECERQNFSHTMPEYNSQQFYELIGKYQNFQGGWTNLTHRPVNDPSSPYFYEKYHDPVFTSYANERQKANDFYDYAKIGPVTAIVNHILSAADAAWVISAYNKKIKFETGFRMENRISPYTYKYEQIPTFNMAVSF